MREKLIVLLHVFDLQVMESSPDFSARKDFVVGF